MCKENEKRTSYYNKHTNHFILSPSTPYSVQNETIYIDYNYGMQTHTQMELTKNINNFKHDLVLYSQWHHRISQKRMLYRKEFQAFKILVFIRHHVTDKLGCSQYIDQLEQTSCPVSGRFAASTVQKEKNKQRKPRQNPKESCSAKLAKNLYISVNISNFN